MLFKAPKTRTFRYTPRFYSEKKEDESRKRRISFRQHLKYSHKKRSWVGLVIMLVIALLVLFNLSRMARKIPDKVDLEDMEIVK